MSKQIDMSAFVGRDFDCEFKHFGQKYWFASTLSEYDTDNKYLFDYKPLNYFEWIQYCRPRLNKPQVLDDWSWIPDGLVVQVKGYPFLKNHYGVHVLTSGQLRAEVSGVVDNDPKIEWASCIGVAPDYAEWGKAHGMEVIEI